MRLRIIILILIIQCCGYKVLSQNYLYHGSNRIRLEHPISDYKKGDTLKVYDSIRKMSLTGVFHSVKFAKNISLYYSDSMELQTIEVAGVIKDSNLYWNGKCIEQDKSSKHSRISFFNMNTFTGVSTYYVREQIQSIDSKKMGNVTTIGIKSETGKPLYYWIKDTLNRENGSNIDFYENGEVKSFGHYKNGIRIGEWFYYDEKGTLLRIEYFKNGVLTRTKKQKIKNR